MLTDLLPLMTATVRHHRPGKRTIHGRPLRRDYTEHSARVMHATGTLPALASKEPQALPSATVWLINHPRIVELTHAFEIAPGIILDVIGVETREIDGGTLTKVYLK